MLKMTIQLILASFSKKTIFKDLELDFEIRLKEIEEGIHRIKRRRNHKLSCPVKSLTLRELKENETLSQVTPSFGNNQKL
jgi:hypothetical protein